MEFYRYLQVDFDTKKRYVDCYRTSMYNSIKLGYDCELY